MDSCQLKRVKQKRIDKKARVVRRTLFSFSEGKGDLTVR